MKNIQCISIFCFFFLAAQMSLASQAQSGDSTRYQLVLYEPDRGPEIMIPIGAKIVCKQKDRTSITGTIMGYTDHAIVLKEEIIPMDGLVSIRYFRRGQKWRGFAGKILKISAGIVAVMGIGSLISSAERGGLEEGLFRFIHPTLFLLCVPLALVGVFLANSGKYNLRRKYDWEMKKIPLSKKN